MCGLVVMQTPLILLNNTIFNPSLMYGQICGSVWMVLNNTKSMLLITLTTVDTIYNTHDATDSRETFNHRSTRAGRGRGWPVWGRRSRQSTATQEKASGIWSDQVRIRHVHIYTCTYVCTYVCMYVCMYVRMYVCTYVCMYVNTFVHVGMWCWNAEHVCMYMCLLSTV